MKYLFGYSDFAYTFDFDNDLSEGTLSQSSPAVLEDVYTITNVAAQGRVTRPASYGFLDASLPFLGGASVLLAAGIGPAIGLDQVPVSWRWMDHDKHVIDDMASLTGSQLNFGCSCRCCSRRKASADCRVS